MTNSNDIKVRSDQLNDYHINEIARLKANLRIYESALSPCRQKLLRSNAPSGDRDVAHCAEKYIKMGMDFERMLQAVYGDETVSNAWNDFLMTMRLAGLDGTQ